MKINRYFSHPILGIPGHFVKGNYRGIICALKITKDEYEVKVKHQIDDPEILSLINNKKASPVTSIRNKAYFWLSEVHSEANSISTIKIPKALIRGNFELEFEFTICAKKNIASYSNSNTNSTYTGYNFKLQKGEFLAIASAKKIKLVPDYVEMSGGSSWMLFEFSSGTNSIKYSIEKERVVFYFPEKYQELFNNLNFKNPQTLVGVLVYPFLVELLNAIRKDADTYEIDETYTWVGSLIDIVDKAGLRLFDEDANVLELADVILEEPIYSALMDVDHLRKSIDNEDE